MTRSNDTIFETNFETGKVRDRGYYGHQFLSTDGLLEEKLAEVKRLSKVPIRNVEDIYQALTNRQTLDDVLVQGLEQEYQKHKDDIVNFFMSLKDSIRKEDLFNAQNSDTYNSDDYLRQQQYAKCSICQGFANINCVNCNNVWLCIDHWKQHKLDRHARSNSYAR